VKLYAEIEKVVPEREHWNRVKIKIFMELDANLAN
jgi:hypothetical protein